MRALVATRPLPLRAPLRAPPPTRVHAPRRSVVRAGAATHVREAGGGVLSRRIHEPEINLYTQRSRVSPFWVAKARPAVVLRCVQLMGAWGLHGRRGVPIALVALRSQLEEVEDFSVSAVLDGRQPACEQLKLHESGVPSSSALTAFEADVAELVREFARLAGIEQVFVQVTWTRQTMCSRLHVDNVGLRLLRTYFGPGTEWVASPTLSRLVSESVRFGGNPLSDAVKAVVTKVAPMERATQGEVVILKGQQYPKSLGKAIVHRSPLLTASEQGQPRLLLKIDDSVPCSCCPPPPAAAS